ncbi:MAG: RHS repeat-associated core domain-containing protein [Chloroflexota bacterium]|nr:RHS repeat-associated core domain-containing protein [Chloroflexota bacterium]
MTWTRLLTNTLQTGYQYPGQPPHTYDFRVRATDHVNNTGAWAEATTVVAQVTKYYHFGAQRVAMRSGDQVSYLYADHLGSVISDGSGALLAAQRYYAYGETRSGDLASLPMAFGFTGQRHEGSIGLYQMGARWYNPVIGRWISADTVVPDFGSPRAWNRYLYVFGNPLKYIDPSGYDPLDDQWRAEFEKNHGRSPEWYDISIRLFSIAFPDEWDWSAFYDTTGNYIEGSLGKVFREEMPKDYSWADIPDALERLAGWYNTGEEELFTRDIGTLFGGLKDRFDEPSAWQAISFAGNPAHVWVYVNPEGLHPLMVGTSDQDANIHHWAWGLAMGSEYGPVGSFINEGREISQFRGDWRNTWSDIAIGNAGASLGASFRLLGFRDIRQSWSIHMMTWVPH